MIQLIPYNAAFSDELAAFVVSFWKVHHGDVTPEQARETLRDWTKDDHRLFAISKNEQIVGFLRAHNSSPTVCWIDDIFVDTPHRGQGVASEAIGMLESVLRAEGIRSFCMEVVPDNLPAMRLYHRLGYDRLSLITMRKDDEPFKTARTETIAGLPLRVKQFDDCPSKT